MNLANWRRVIDQINAHPESWDQSVWHCGTKHCFAGWAQILAGKPEIKDLVIDQAMSFLGISYPDANYYFSSERTLQDLEWPLSEAALKGAYDCCGHNIDGLTIFGEDRFGSKPTS